MNINNAKDYLNMLKIAVSGIANEAEVQDTEDGPVLLCTTASPFDANGELGYQISLTPYENGTVIAEIAVIVFTGIENSLFSGLDILLNALNERLMIGSYRLFDESGAVMFIHGMLLNDTVGEKTTIGMIGNTMKLMENIVFSTGGFIRKYLSGGSPEDIMNEIGKTGE